MIGIILMNHKKKYARNFVQFGIGLYMLIYLGIVCRENMQIEGFWYYLFVGVFESAMIHYFVAKICGPIFFGRGWCGYACWTGMILDLLPYKIPKYNRKRLGWIRYITFALSLIFVSSLFIFKDNRAFCKYICPVAIFLKPASYYSYLRVKCDHDKCINCKKCIRNCPMNVNMLDDSRKRKNATECILCCNCIKECPKKALDLK
ncbi:MAG: 4Fe-4S binding protein [Bacilli bacterium]